MKRILFIGALIALCLQIGNAQTARRSDRKIIELKKIISLNLTQEAAIRAAYEKNEKTNDSIVDFVQDPATAAELKYLAEKEYYQLFTGVLTEEQLESYFSVTGTPAVKRKAEAMAAQQSQKSNYTTAQQDSVKNALFNYQMQAHIISSCNKYDNQKKKESMDLLKQQLRNPLSKTEQKMAEMKRIIILSPTQETAIREAYNKCDVTKDSIRNYVSDNNVAEKLNRDAGKALHTSLMKNLTENQRNKYIRAISIPKVTERTEKKLALLKETGTYTPAQLDSAKTQIFDYLMLEQVVRYRDKYDDIKRKENLKKLKNVRPAYMREVSAKEKMKVMGNGNMNRYQF